MKKNIKYITIYILSILICINLCINLPQVYSIVGPHTIAGYAYYDFNILYTSVNATVDAHNDDSDEWIYNVDTVSISGLWNFNVGPPVPDWSNGDQITIYIHQDNQGEYHGWNGTITTIINTELSPQIVSNCYLTSPTDIKNENDNKHNNSNNTYNGENITNENDTIPVSDKEENNTMNGNFTDDTHLKKPVLIGPRNGEQNIVYNYTFNLSYPNEDNFQYIVDWGDNTNYSSIISVENITPIILKHTWDTAGIYIIKTYAKDNNNSLFEYENLTVLINVIYCNSIGFIIDTDNDKIYDTFQSNETRERTNVEQENEYYLIDENGDDIWDYSFNIEFGLSKYQKNNKTESPAFEMIYLVISLFIVLYLFKRKK